MSSRVTRKCTQCEECIPRCPTGSIFMGTNRAVIDSDTCSDCQLCFQVCPEDAIIPVHYQDEDVPQTKTNKSPVTEKK